MLNWIRRNPRRISSRSTSSSTANRISTTSCNSRVRYALFSGKILSPECIYWLEREVLPFYLPRCRWFGGKSRTIRSVRLREIISISSTGLKFAILTVRYRTGKSESYSLPLALVSGTKIQHILSAHPEGVICECSIDSRPAMLIDGMYDPQFRRRIFRIITQGEQIRDGKAWIGGIPAPGQRVFSAKKDPPVARILQVQQSNTAIVFGGKFYFKLFRKLETGTQPDVELPRYLGERRHFARVPKFAGTMELVGSGGDHVVLGMLQAYVSSRTDAWTYVIGQVGKYFECVLSKSAEDRADMMAPSFRETIKLLGRRTAEMHRALSRKDRRADFRPEFFSSEDLRSISREMEKRARSVLGLLRDRCADLPSDIQIEARAVLGTGEVILKKLRLINRIDPDFFKIRVHGDYHLGQVLLTAKGDLVFIDFEGEPARPLSERRRKQTVAKDVVGMLRSLHYAAHVALLSLNVSGRKVEATVLLEAAGQWYSMVSGMFLNSYFRALGGGRLFPEGQYACEVLLDVYWLDKAIYELNYELNHRPQWVAIPLRGIQYILQSHADNNRGRDRVLQ